MKRIAILLTAFLGILFSACEKDENKVFFEGGTEPVLTSSASTISLSFAAEAEELMRLNWTNPNYSFNTGVSSQDVNYVVEIDVAGANFKSPNKQSVSISRELTVAFTVGQFNDYLLNQLLLQPGVSRDIEIRVVASLGNLGAGSLASNTLTYSVTPYAIPPKVTPPATGALYITGSATPANWMGGGDPEVPAQKFTKLSDTVFELANINLTGGGSFLFVPAYGNWNAKYGYIGANNGNNVNGDDFKAEGGDMLAPAASGAYKITVDFQRGKFTVTKL